MKIRILSIIVNPALKFLLLTCSCCFLLLDTFSQPVLISTSTRGGNGLGTIFSFNSGNNFVSTSYPFECGPATGSEGSHLVELNGLLYGMAEGGVNSQGIIYSYNLVSGIFSKLYDFNDSTGVLPQGSLYAASNGKLYGLAAGGRFQNDVVFEFDPLTNVYTKKQELNATTGSGLRGSFIGESGNKLLAPTYYFGAFNGGTILEYDFVNDTISKVFNLDASIAGCPVGDLMQASNGKYYALAQVSPSNYGAIIEYDAGANTYSRKYSFTVNDGYPASSLTEASNGKLYGMTPHGGVYGYGELFEFDYISNSFQKKYDFDYNTGSTPLGGLTSLGNGKLIGLTYNGGTSGKGVIFEWDVSTDTYSVLAEFTDSTGSCSRNTLMIASDGMAYGATSFLGLANLGTLFKFDTSAFGITKLIDFGRSLNGAIGFASLIQASNGKIYGMTQQGGQYEQGVLYEYDFPSNNYVKKVDLDSSIGRVPSSSLIELANGKLYGTTKFGGSADFGVLFEFDFNTNVFTPKYNFTYNSANPTGDLLRASNGKIYGTAKSGGMSSVGLIYEYDFLNNHFLPLYSFHSIDGEYPLGGLIEGPNGKLYGLTYQGGANGFGTLFEYDTIAHTFTKKIEFSDQFGGYPASSLVDAGNGLLCGVLGGGYAHPFGGIFIYYLSTNSCSVVYDFYSSGYSDPKGLFRASNGKLYGAFQYNGQYDGGAVYEYNLQSNSFSSMIGMYGASGMCPTGYFVEYDPNLNNIDPLEKDSKFVIYPNPTDRLLTIALKEAWNNDIQFDLSDMRGRIVFSGKMKFNSDQRSQSIDLSMIPDGIYVLKLQSGKFCEITKVVVQ